MASRSHVSRVTKTAMKKTADVEQINGDTHPDLIPKTLGDRPVLNLEGRRWKDDKLAKKCGILRRALGIPTAENNMAAGG